MFQNYKREGKIPESMGFEEFLELLQMSSQQGMGRQNEGLASLRV